MMATDRRMEKIERVVANRQQGALVLEDVADPYNAAAVFRSCDALGFQTIHLVFEKEKRFDPQEIGRYTATSANKWLDFVYHDSIVECLSTLHANGFETIATVVEDGEETLQEARIESARVAILLGNEKRGLTPQAIELAQRRISIPMLGMMESLNLSVTASIFMFEITRQRKHLGGQAHYGLDPSVASGLKSIFLNKNNVIMRRRN
jgi:tRNA (guanosine-2'-O-)-methyltransferase